MRRPPRPGLNRGEKEKSLQSTISRAEEQILRYLEKQVIVRDNPYTAPVLKEVTEDSYDRLSSSPAIESEVRNDLNRDRRRTGP